MRAAAANAAGVGESELERVTGCVLVNGDEARHAAPFDIRHEPCVTRALRRDHHDVDGGLRLDEPKMDIEAVGEGDRRTVKDVRGDFRLVDAGLELSGGRLIIIRSAIRPLRDGHDLGSRRPSAFLAVAEPALRAMAAFCAPILEIQACARPWLP